MALFTIDDYRTATGMTGQDAKIAQAILVASAIVANETNLLFSSTAKTEYYQGSGTHLLVLRYRPVTAVTSIHEHQGGYFGTGTDAFDSTTLLTVGTDYAPRWTSASLCPSGIIHRLRQPWPRATQATSRSLVQPPMPGVGNIKVVYTAGYADTAAPSDLKMAGIMLTSLVMDAAKSGQLMQSESLDYYSYSAKSSDEAARDYASAKRLLGRYREVHYA